MASSLSQPSSVVNPLFQGPYEIAAFPGPQIPASGLAFKGKGHTSPTLSRTDSHGMGICCSPAPNMFSSLNAAPGGQSFLATPPLKHVFSVTGVWEYEA